MWNFYTVFLQIHSGNRLQKIGILDLKLIKLLQNEQGCIFLPHNVVSHSYLLLCSDVQPYVTHYLYLET